MVALGASACGAGGTSDPATTATVPPSSQNPTVTTTSAPAWQTKQIDLHIDGQISIDGGEPLTRGTQLIAVLGRPERSTTQTVCGSDAIRNTLHRWGDLVVTVLDQQPPGPNILGWSRGSIIGWDLAPSEGASTVMPTARGPEGTAIGDDLASLEEAFRGDGAGSVERDESSGKREFGVWYGDAGVGYVLDGGDRVAEMYSGHSCAPRSAT